MKTIAITGGIGSGKTLISNIMRASGYPVYDSDTRAKILTATSPVIRKGLKDLLGEEIYEGGRLNREKLAAILFNDESYRLKINAIIHPAVFDDFKKWRNAQKCKTVFIESAILFESHFDALADEIWCVTAPKEIRVQRVMKRNGISRRQVEERIATQMSDEEMRLKSTREIVNDEKIPVLSQLAKYIFNA